MAYDFVAAVDAKQWTFLAQARDIDFPADSHREIVIGDPPFDSCYGNCAFGQTKSLDAADEPTFCAPGKDLRPENGQWVLLVRGTHGESTEMCQNVSSNQMLAVRSCRIAVGLIDRNALCDTVVHP
jgi:hypothetical protein